MKRCLILINVFLLIFACSVLKKDGVYELNIENVNFKLELPCKDEVVSKYEEFKRAMYNETSIDESSLDLGNLAIGKLTIDNRTDSYLKEGSSPLKIVLNTYNDKVIEGINMDRLFQMYRSAAESKGKNVHITYTGGIRDYTHTFFNEKYNIQLLEKEEIAIKVMQVRSELGSIALEALPSIILIRIELTNDGGQDIMNRMNEPAYKVSIAKRDGKKIDALHIVSSMEEFQKKIERNMNAVSKDVRKYNSLVYLYNKCAEIIKDSLKEKREIIRDGQKSVDYYIAENVIRDDIGAIELRGGKFTNAGDDIIKEIIKGYEMPVKPNSQSILYIAFPNFEEKELKKIYLSIGQVVEEMK